ncbi:MAG TPA: hypothetical protein VGJ60_34050 [Chloroflexota bacterium]
MTDADALLAAAEAIAEEADQRLARADIRAAIAFAPQIVGMAWNVVPSGGEPIWTVRLAARRQVTSELLNTVLNGLARAQCTWTWGTSPVTGFVACRVQLPEGPYLELIFTLPRMIGQLGEARRQNVMCLTTSPFQPDAHGTLLGDIVFWYFDGADLTRVLGEWSTRWRRPPSGDDAVPTI